jgi:hypothetical protein
MRHDQSPAGGDEAVAVDDAVEIDLTHLPPISSKALSHLRMHLRGGGPVSPKFLIEEVTDPDEIARHKAQRERARRNRDWLQAHWPDLLPQARGKFIAVAGQEAFIADSPEEAWQMAKAAHPDDDGAIDQYVRPELGPRIYAYTG